MASEEQSGKAGTAGTFGDPSPKTQKEVGFYETTEKRLVDAESKLETYRKVLVDNSSGLTDESRESLRASVELLETQVGMLKRLSTQVGEYFVLCSSYEECVSG
jgi:hypothetical protein